MDDVGCCIVSYQHIVGDYLDVVGLLMVMNKKLCFSFAEGTHKPLYRSKVVAFGTF